MYSSTRPETIHLVVYCLLHSIPTITEMQVGVEVCMLHVYRMNHDRQLCNSCTVS